MHETGEMWGGRGWLGVSEWLRGGCQNSKRYPLTTYSKSTKILSSEGRCCSISSRGPIDFYPPKGDAKHIQLGSNFFVTSVFFWVRQRTSEKKGHPRSVILAEFYPRNFLLYGWDGLDRRVGRLTKVSLNFLWFWDIFNTTPIYTLIYI